MDRAEAERLAEERSRLRQARAYADADAVRDRLRDGGWEVVDGAGGFELREAVRPRQVTLLTLVHGWPEDARRWAESALEHTRGQDAEVVAVLNGAGSAPAGARALELPQAVGWAEAANRGLEFAAGGVVILFDPGVELTGDVASPLLEALEDPGTALAGAFGVRCQDGVLGHFQESRGPEVDALEGYCLAFRREQAIECGGFDPKFRFYRIADFDFSFRMRERYGRAVVIPDLPLVKHAHRLWEALDEAERERLSKRNFFRFLDRWRGREDLLVERG